MAAFRIQPAAFEIQLVTWIWNSDSGMDLESAGGVCNFSGIIWNSTGFRFEICLAGFQIVRMILQIY